MPIASCGWSQLATVLNFTCIVSDGFSVVVAAPMYGKKAKPQTEDLFDSLTNFVSARVSLQPFLDSTVPVKTVKAVRDMDLDDVFNDCVKTSSPTVDPEDGPVLDFASAAPLRVNALKVQSRASFSDLDVESTATPVLVLPASIRRASSSLRSGSTDISDCLVPTVPVVVASAVTQGQRIGVGSISSGRKGAMDTRTQSAPLSPGLRARRVEQLKEKSCSALLLDLLFGRYHVPELRALSRSHGVDLPTAAIASPLPSHRPSDTDKSSVKRSQKTQPGPGRVELPRALPCTLGICAGKTVA
jgi:hypothetical protein